MSRCYPFSRVEEINAAHASIRAPSFRLGGAACSAYCKTVATKRVNVGGRRGGIARAHVYARVCTCYSGSGQRRDKRGDI